MLGSVYHVTQHARCRLPRVALIYLADAGVMAARVFTVSPVLGPVEAERCQAGPRHSPRLHCAERLLGLYDLSL